MKFIKYLVYFIFYKFFNISLAKEPSALINEIVDEAASVLSSEDQLVKDN